MREYQMNLMKVIKGKICKMLVKITDWYWEE